MGIGLTRRAAGLRGLTPETLAATGTIFTPRPAFQLTRFDRGPTLPSHRGPLKRD